MIHLIEMRVNEFMIAGCALGLLWPYWSWAGDWLVMAILMTATFIACFKLSLAEFKSINWRIILPFFIGRFVFVPTLVFYVFSMIAPLEIALAALLIASLPTGVSSPAMTHVLGGQVTLTAMITLTSTLFAPLTMPALFSLASAESAGPTPEQLFSSLLVILILPCAAFLLLRHVRPIKTKVAHYGKAATVVLVALMLAIVVGKQQEMVLQDIPKLIAMVGLTWLILSSLLSAGWLVGRWLDKPQQKALAISSGFNNAALGVALAALHFSPPVILMMVGAELAWTLLPFTLKILQKKF